MAAATEASSFEHLVSELDFTAPTWLCYFMSYHRSDKGSLSPATSQHNYTILYNHLFESMRDRPLRIFELGLGTNNTDVPSNMGPSGRPGASLYGWREYFPNASIFGADIDRRILFESDRIRTYYCDQTNPDSIRDLWDSPGLSEEGFDIIVEDGLHKHAANVCFFENSIHKLNVGGYYIIEDLYCDQRHLHEASLEEWKTRFPNMKFGLLVLPSKTNIWDNTVILVQRMS